MFNERKIICIHLILFAFLPLINKKKDNELILPWLVCSSTLFVFPFLSTELKDSLPLM